MKRFLLSSFLVCVCISINAADTLSLNKGWRFRKGVELRSMDAGEAVDLPHTWNASDALFGNREYYRGMCTYAHELTIPETLAGKRYYLLVNAAQTIADVFIDNHFVTQHRGGYTAFVADLTPFVTPGKKHLLHIRVNNTHTTEVAPLSGDFNIYGGLYRGVDLIVTEKTCINPDFYASSGVFFKQRSVTEHLAVIDVETRLLSEDGSFDGYTVTCCIYDGDKMIASGASTEFKKEGTADVRLEVENPHLWNGKADPHLYKGVVTLTKDGREVDRRVERIGLRYYHADPDKGFFLNGHPYRLNGANVHQDRAERANAYRGNDFAEDLDIAEEMGCNALRLAHYPHSREIYHLMDERGMVAWTEIPFVNIFISNPAYRQNLLIQLKELIYQYYNHPSILSWGLFNEANSGWMEDVNEIVAELNALAHELDTTRPTMGASNQNDRFNGYPDYIAFNKYFGWYGNRFEDMADWVDKEHAGHPERCMGISEYGAGADVFQQSEDLIHPEPWGQCHPENWQTEYHINNWRILKDREYLWCNFIWVLFDFGSSGRREGTIPGRNDKGLVSYDRKIKKDAFYFYKANWNKDEQILYIEGRRNVERTKPETTVRAFSNSGPAELFVNGKSYGKSYPDEVNVIVWENVILSEGNNEIVVKNRQRRDRCVWRLSHHQMRK